MTFIKGILQLGANRKINVVNFNGKNNFAVWKVKVLRALIAQNLEDSRS